MVRLKPCNEKVIELTDQTKRFEHANDRGEPKKQSAQSSSELGALSGDRWLVITTNAIRS
jgi:hypothetical protein